MGTNEKQLRDTVLAAPKGPGQFLSRVKLQCTLALWLKHEEQHKVLAKYALAQRSKQSSPALDKISIASAAGGG